MQQVLEFIQSGIIELYVFGLASDEEMAEVEQMAGSHDAIRNAIDATTAYLEQFAADNAVPPPPVLKPMLLATINYIERMENGEAPSFPPLLNENSKIDDYSQWLGRSDMILPAFLTDVYARIIGNTQQASTAIVWIKDMAPAEAHHDEYERFLIVEGTCDIIVEDTVYSLTPGDYMSIPLYKNHTVVVTSGMPCKAILQRVAA